MKDRYRTSIGIIIDVVAILMIVYQMASSVYHFILPLEHLGIHLTFALTLVLLSIMKKSRKYWLVKLSFLLLSAGISTYVVVNTWRLTLLTGSLFIPMLDLVIGGLLVVILLETLREIFGNTLTSVISIFVLYTIFGSLVPYPLNAPHFRFTEVLSRMSLGGLGEAGIYGSVLRISANSIFMFVVFSGLLGATGATRFFIQIGRLLGSKLAGGPGLTAVVASALLGTITGSPVANVAGTGSFTIPMMKASGYRPEQAGGIEAVASTGGQIMPPVMGSAAFILADFTGISYAKVMVMATIPALLYYMSAFCYVQFQGAKLNLGRVCEPPDYKEMLGTAHLFVLPLGILVVTLLIGLAPGLCASTASVVLLILSLARKKRPKLKELVNGFTDGAIRGAEVAVTCAALGLIVTSFSWTGLGMKLPYIVEAVSGGNILIALIITMVVSIILGMGMPTPAVYIMVAMAAIPALIRFGIPLLPAHMFAFYFGCLSFITPPVAMASLVASKMADASFWKTSFEAVKVALGGFAIPFLMVFAPALLLMPKSGPIPATLGILGAFVGVITVQIAVCGYYLGQVNFATRTMFGLLAAAAMIAVSMGWSIVIAALIGVFLLFTIWRWVHKKKLQLVMQ